MTTLDTYHTLPRLNDDQKRTIALTLNALHHGHFTIAAHEVLKIAASDWYTHSVLISCMTTTQRARLAETYCAVVQKVYARTAPYMTPESVERNWSLCAESYTLFDVDAEQRAAEVLQKATKQ